MREDVLTTKAVHAAEAFPWPRTVPATAACVGHDPELWFPVTVEAYEAAVAVCRTCPLAELCERVASARGEHGVWGGVLFKDGKRLAAMPVPGRPRTAA